MLCHFKYKGYYATSFDSGRQPLPLYFSVNMSINMENECPVLEIPCSKSQALTHHVGFHEEATMVFQVEWMKRWEAYYHFLFFQKVATFWRYSKYNVIVHGTNSI